MYLDLLDVCDPETRKNCATLKESLMDVDSNFDDDYNSVNALRKKKKTKEQEIKSKKKVTFDCADDNSSNEYVFDYEYDDDNLSKEENIVDDLENENVSDEETVDDKYEDENMSDEEYYSNDHEEEFDYHHENEKSSEEDCSSSELNENLLSNDSKTDNMTKNLKEDIYGRLRKPDGTVVVSYSFWH